MFLNSLLEENAALADVALHLIGDGAILPDTYVLDLDMIRENASKIAAEANTYGLKSYFMLKQLGRNPLLRIPWRTWASVVRCVSIIEKP